MKSWCIGRICTDLPRSAFSISRSDYLLKIWSPASRSSRRLDFDAQDRSGFGMNCEEKRPAAVLAIAHEFLFGNAGVNDRFKPCPAEGAFDWVSYFHGTL
jgi:hypothetical protein